jgi:hypothetical protein
MVIKNKIGGTLFLEFLEMQYYALSLAMIAGETTSQVSKKS